MFQHYILRYLLAFLVVYNLLLSNLQAFSATTGAALWVESPTPATEPDVDYLSNIPTPFTESLPREEERVRQAIEIKLSKYSRHYSIYYQLSLMQVFVEGNWAYATVPVQDTSQITARLLTIIVQRLPNGQWLALLPQDTEGYLQWLSSIPETLILSGTKEQIKNELFTKTIITQTSSITETAGVVQDVNIIGSSSTRKNPPSTVGSNFHIFLPYLATKDDTTGNSFLQQFNSQHFDPVMGLSLQYDPFYWVLTLLADNRTETSDAVSIRTLGLANNTEGAWLIITAFRNSAKLDLNTWIAKYDYSRTGVSPTYKKGTVSGFPAITIDESSLEYQGTPPNRRTVIRVDTTIYLIEYASMAPDYLNFEQFLNGLRFFTPSSQFSKSYLSLTLAESYREAEKALPSSQAIASNMQSLSVQTCCGITDSEYNPFPCPSDGSHGNCTWWVRYRRTGDNRANLYACTGNASTWDECAATHYPDLLANSASVNAAAVWTGSNQNHVQFIERLNSNGSYHISEMNWPVGTLPGTCQRDFDQTRTLNIQFIRHPGDGGLCPAPSLDNPTDGQTFPDHTISFSWQSLSGCTFNGYTFRVKNTADMESGGTTIIDTGEGGTSRTETFGSQWDNQDLYWGVKAANAPSATWAVRRFRIQPSTGGSLNPPEFVSPGDNQTLNTRTVNFVWQNPNATNQTGYTFRLSASASPDTQPWLVDTGVGNEHTSRDFTFAADSTFFWHMRTWNSAGQASSWRTRQFKIDTAGGGDNDVVLCTSDDGSSGCWAFPVGMYNDLSSFSLNDQIRSAFVPSGKSVFLFREGGLRGTAECYSGNRSPLPSGDPWDLRGQVTGVQVFGQSNCPTSQLYSVVMYDGTNFGGHQWGVGYNPGVYNIDDLAGIAHDYFNDRAESMRVPAGWSVRLYEHASRGGQSSSCLMGDVTNLGSLNNQASSVEIFREPNCPNPPPAAPSDLQVSNTTADSITVRWHDNSANESGFKLYRWGYNGTTWDFLYLTTVGPNTTSYTDGGLNCKADYYYKMMAYNDAGTSAETNWVQGVTTACPVPNSPSLQSPSENEQIDEGQSIILRWNAVNGATEYYGEITGGPAGILTFGWQAEQMQNIGSQWAGYTYTWQVKARGTGGESDWSNERTFIVKPATPTNLTAQAASCTQINLTWSDNAGSEEGFRLYSGNQFIAQLGANVTNYQNTNLTPNTTYSYVVKAFRGNIESTMSNSASINTGACTATAAISVDEAPAPAVISSGDYASVTYHFTEHGGVGVHITGRKALFTLLDGSTTISNQIGPYSNDIAIPANGTTEWVDSIYLPSEVVVVAQQNGSSGVLLNTTFTGTDTSGRSVLVNSSLRINFDTCDDPSEPNGTIQQATAISYGQTHSAVVCPVGDRDMYSFFGSAGDNIQIDIDAVVNDSPLDSIVYLFDSDGATLLSMADDSDNLVDPRLIAKLPHTGQYYISVRPYTDESGGAAYFYKLQVSVDNVDPVIEILSPTNNGWLHPTKHLVTVTASDNETAVHHVDFHFHDDNWANPEWLWLGSDLDGSDGWSWELDTSTLTEDKSVAIFAYAYDNVGHPKGHGAYNLKVDRTLPSSTVLSLPEKTSNVQFIVQWQGTDNYTPNAQLVYDVQYQLDCTSVWVDWISKGKLTEAIFTGQAGHSYCFRSRAYDLPGNTEAWVAQADAHTEIMTDASIPTFTSTPTSDIQPPITATPTPTDGKPPVIPSHTIYLPSIQQSSKSSFPATSMTPVPTTISSSSTIAFVSDRDGNYEIYRMDMNDPQSTTRLTNNTALDYGPDWSPDGSKIAFDSDRDGKFYEIYVMNADGTGQTRLTNNTFRDAGAAWSPSGSKIAFASDRDGNFYEIYVMNADGSNPTRLTNNTIQDAGPDWSPDGTKIAYASWLSNDNIEIYVMNADGTGQTRLTNVPGFDDAPHWSTDGTKIIFNSLRDGLSEIYVMNVDGSNQKRLTNHPARDFVSDWSPNGQKLIFRSDRDGNWELYTMNTDGSGQTRLTNTTSFEDSATWKP